MGKKIIVGVLAGILGFLLLGWGYNLLIGKPITINHYFSNHHVSYMKIGLTNNAGSTVKTKELTNEELEDFINQYGSYKIFVPFFRRTNIAKQKNNYIGIYLTDETKDFEVMFTLTDKGEVNLSRYTFYPYKSKHIDMYNYLLDLLNFK